MAGFLYYIAGADGVTAEKAKELGLGYAVGDWKVTICRVHERGPDGGAGVIIADHRRVEEALVGNYPDRGQQWRRIGQGPVWVGWYEQHRPGPSDVIRTGDGLGGRPVELADGRAWLIPVARNWDDDHWVLNLPATLDLNENGHWSCTEIATEYRDLHRRLLRWWDAQQRALFAAADEAGEETVRTEIPEEEFSFEEAVELAADLLAVNYVVTRWEIACLGLLDSRRVSEVLGVATDFGFFLESLKKKALTSARGESPTGDGPPGEAPTITAQP